MDLVEDQKHPSSFLLNQDSSDYVISALDKFGFVKTFDIRMCVNQKRSSGREFPEQIQQTGPRDCTEH
jgi:hypothetical protein